MLKKINTNMISKLCFYVNVEIFSDEISCAYIITIAYISTSITIKKLHK